MFTVRTVRLAIVAVFLIYVLQAFGPLRLVSDGIDYLLQASSAADGAGFLFHGRQSMRPAGYPFLVFVLMKIGLGKPWAIVALNCLCLALGCVASYSLSQKIFDLSPRGASLVGLLTLSSFVIIKQAAQPLSDICFFGFSTACLLLLLYVEENRRGRLWLLIPGAMLVLLCIEIRTVGIALIPAFAWVLLGGTSFFTKVPAWLKQHGIASLGLLFLVIVVATCAGRILLHSRYFQFNRRIFINRGAGVIVTNFKDHTQEWGEMIVNLPLTKLPQFIVAPVRVIGFFGLLVFAVGLWKQSKRSHVSLWYVLSFACLVLSYPWSDSRLWLPLLPLLVGYCFVGLSGTVNARFLKLTTTAYCACFFLLGLAALTYSSRITFSQPAHFVERYGDGSLRDTYKVAFGLPDANSTAVDQDALYLLRRFK